LRGKCWFIVALFLFLPFTQHNSLLTDEANPSFAPYQVQPEEPSESPNDYVWTNLKTVAAFDGDPDNVIDIDFRHEYDVDVDGNWYFMGEFRETIHFGNTSLVPVGWNDIFVAKYSAEGEWEWAKALHGENQHGDYNNLAHYGHALQVHSDGSVYVSGAFRANLTLGPFTLSSTVHDVPREEVFVAKLTTHGEWIWATSGGGSWVDEAHQMELTPEGEVVILGNSFTDHINPTFGDTEFTNPDTKRFVAKLSKDGDWLWAHQYGRGVSKVPFIQKDALHIDENGNIYVGASTNLLPGELFFGDLPVEPIANDTAYITKILPNGTFSWLKTFNSTCLEIEDIEKSTGGDIFFGGYWDDSCDKDESDEDLQALSYNNSNCSLCYDQRGFVAKMAQNGDLKWVSHIHGYGHSSVSMLTMDEQDRLFVAGMTEWGKIKLGTLETEHSGSKSFVSEISSDGEWQWSVLAKGDYPGFSDSSDGGIKSIEHHEGKLTVSGFFGEDDGFLDPYSINVESGMVHFSADLEFFDSDEDGVSDSTDRCMRGATGWVSTNETDMDGDGCRDADEDDDDDNDGILDEEDDCPGYDNSNDMDCDGIPDWEDDSDGDGIMDQDDECPGEDDNLDTDRDEVPNCQDEDDDDDGVDDADDACPLVDQEIDWNCNGISDLEEDSDNDGVVDWYDVCQGHDDQLDVNENGIPDGCEKSEAIVETPENNSESGGQDSKTNNSGGQDNKTNTSTLDDEAGSTVSTTVFAVGASAFGMVALAAVMLSRRRSKNDIESTPKLNITLVEAYVQQLVELGHPEDFARAHAIAHYSNMIEQQN